MKNPIKLNLADNTIIIMSRTFAERSAYPGTPEYKLLQETRRDYPDFTVVRREIKKNPNMEHYKGLTYEYMRWYIETYERKENLQIMLEAFDKMQNIAKCHSSSKRYPAIKRWFLEQYPEVKEFGVETVDGCENLSIKPMPARAIA